MKATPKCVKELLSRHRDEMKFEGHEAVKGHSKEVRAGINLMMENILHVHKCYFGFAYVDKRGNRIGLDHPEFCEQRRYYFEH